MLSAELKHTLKRLRDVPIEYSEQHRGFVYSHTSTNREPKRGLTKVLREIIPVPLGGQRPAKRARALNDTDPEPVRKVWRRTVCRTSCAASCKQATLHRHVDGVEPTFGLAGFGPHFSVRHGKLVDQQLKFLVRNGYGATLTADMLMDPCTATLRDYFHAHGLALIASQVPLYSADLEIATALDVLCTDSATRTEMHLFEIKSTTSDSSDDEMYTRVRGRLKSSVARGTPISFYVEHQLQLGVMDSMIRDTLEGRGPTSARVLRVSPNCVTEYPLTPWFNSTSKKLLSVIRRRAQRSVKRRAKNKPTNRLTK